MLLVNKVLVVVCVGVIVLCEVIVLVQNIGFGFEKIFFFQVLGIIIKIFRGIIEILSDVQLIKIGDKVGVSEVMLLNMFNIFFFFFGLVIQQVFDNGSIYNFEVFDIIEEILYFCFLEGVCNVVSVCLQIGYLIVVLVFYFIINGYK